MGRGIVCAAVVLTLACGSGQARRGAGTPDAGVADSGAVDAGVPDGGQGDAGTQDAGVDAGSPDAGVDAGMPDAGVDGGEPDAGVDGGDSDAGTPDGGLAECDGLVPARLPDPNSARMLLNQSGAGPNYGCLEGTSDGLGAVVVGGQNAFQPHDTPMRFFAPNGEQSGEYTAVGFVPIPQQSGFLGLDIYGANFEHDVLALASDGSVRRRVDDARTAGIAANDPLGGMVVWSAPDLSAEGELRAYDFKGELRWAVPMTLGGLLETLGVDREGNVLLLTRHSSGDIPDGLDGQWVSHEGAPVGGPFAAVRIGDFRPSEFTLFPRVGNGLFLKHRSTTKSEWLAAFGPRSSEVGAVPAWLAAHPDASLHMIHGGRGYAILPAPGQSVARCEQVIEIVAPSGRSCGMVSLPISDSACTTGSVAVGYDGTVIQRLPSDSAACEGSLCPCDWRWWTGLLR